MQKLQCELCGSIDIIKTEDNVFQCQHCGCKYTLEQAKTLIFGGEVKTKATDFEITGGVLKAYNGEEIDVIVPDNVLKIGEGAFENLSVHSIKLPGGLKEIERRAFHNCRYLTSLMIPEGVESIGEDAFIHCSSLTTIILPAKLRSIALSFAGCSSLVSICFPEGVTKVCCQNCASLQSAQLPESVIEIQCGAFEGCVSLNSIRLPKGLKRVFNGAFSGCTSLTDIIIPDGAEAIDIDGNSMSWIRLFIDSDWGKRRREWLIGDRCVHCGGKFVRRGLFKQVCAECGHEKDY